MDAYPRARELALAVDNVDAADLLKGDVGARLPADAVVTYVNVDPETVIDAEGHKIAPIKISFVYDETSEFPQEASAPGVVEFEEAEGGLNILGMRAGR